MSPMPAPTVLVVLADGFEEIETVTPVDLLRRSGATVTVAALGTGIHVTGRSGITLHADSTLESVMGLEFDCLLLPGGPGVPQLRADPRVAERITRQRDRGGWIAAICAAPLVLKGSGILETHRYTAHFSVSDELTAALLGERVVSDGKLLTSRGAGTAVDFGLMLVEKLFSPQKAKEIAASISA